MALASAAGAIAMSQALVTLGWHGLPLDALSLVIGFAFGTAVSKVERHRRNNLRPDE
jgi:hypothetical protein